MLKYQNTEMILIGIFCLTCATSSSASSSSSHSHSPSSSSSAQASLSAGGKDGHKLGYGEKLKGKAPQKEKLATYDGIVILSESKTFTK